MRGHQDLRVQLLELHLQLGQLRVGLLDDGVDVGDRLLVFGDLAQVLGALFDLQLLLDLAPQVLAQLLQLLRQRRVREVRLDAVLDAQLVQQTQAEVIVLKRRKKMDEHMSIVKMIKLRL